MEYYHEREPVPDSAAFNNPLIGWAANSRDCVECRAKSPWRNQRFISLSLQVRPTLERCLKNYIEPEVISDYKCDK